MNRFYVQYNGAQYVVYDRKGDVKIDSFSTALEARQTATKLNEEKGW